MIKVKTMKKIQKIQRKTKNNKYIYIYISINIIKIFTHAKIDLLEFYF